MARKPRARIEKENPYKTIDGRIIKPIRYVGKFGDYMAGVDPSTGQMIEKDGRPIPYKQIVGDKKP